MRKVLFLALLFAFSGVWSMDNGSVIVDVRSDKEYQEGHIEGALHKPHDQIDESISSLLPDKSRHIVLYCGSGKRAGMAKEKLEELGYTNVENAGGYKDMQKRLAKPATP